MNKLLVVIVDDDEKIAKLLKSYFENDGFDTLLARDGYTGLDSILTRKPDMVILDLMLPGIDGYEVCRRVRKESDVPIIMLTARDEETDRLMGLDIGADDYVAKPFSPREIVARAKAILRRVQKVPVKNELITVGRIRIDPERFEIRVDDKVLDVTPTEFKLLEFLVSNAGRVYSRLQLVERVQGYSFEGYERTIDAHIKNIRKKIGDNPKAPEMVKTVYGIGYKFTGEE